MATVLIRPDPVSAVYEKIPVRVRGDLGDIGDLSVTVYFTTETGDKSVTLSKPTGPEGYADFDLSGVLKRGFRNYRYVRDELISVDYRLFGSYRLTVAGSLFDYRGLHYIRQVQQFGFRKQYLPSDRPRALVIMPGALKRYDGYPLEIAALNPYGDDFEINVTVLKNDTYLLGSDFSAAVAVISLTLSDEAKESNTLRISYSADHNYYSIVDECVPDDPFYVRWINELGGWDYRMFGNRKFIEDVIEDVENIQTPERDDEYDTQATIGLTAYRYVEVGADQLSIEEFNALRKLGRSPQIQYWDVDAQAWFTIVLRKENTITSETDTPKAEIGYVFQMQRIRLQF